MTPSAWTLAEWLLLASALGGAVAWVVKVHIDRRKNDADTDATIASTKRTLAELVDGLIKDVATLNARVDALEKLLDQKEAEVRKLKYYILHLLKWLNDRGITDYPQPEHGLLDTDPNIPAIKGKK